MKIKLYGADWCADCISLKKFLEEKDIKYKEIVISNNSKAIDLLERVNNGKRIIPTLDIDGKIYSNPGIAKLIEIIDEKT